MDFNRLQKVISDCCERKGESARTAFVESGVGRSFYDNINKGSVPSVDKLQALAVYFGVSLDYLVGNTDVPEVNRAEETPQIALARAIVALPPDKQEMISKLVADLAALNSK